jgi:hypothetical protein
MDSSSAGSETWLSMNYVFAKQGTRQMRTNERNLAWIGLDEIRMVESSGFAE